MKNSMLILLFFSMMLLVARSQSDVHGPKQTSKAHDPESESINHNTCGYHYIDGKMVFICSGKKSLMEHHVVLANGISLFQDGSYIINNDLLILSNEDFIDHTGRITPTFNSRIHNDPRINKSESRFLESDSSFMQIKQNINPKFSLIKP